jgi:serine/threonine protein kinase
VQLLSSIRDLHHPNLIRLRDVFTSSRHLVLCMDKADGNLDELREAYRQEIGGNIPPDHLLELLRQAAVGLDYLANMRLPGFTMTLQGLQHCDVKPSNLLLQGDEVKIADFGLCAGMGQQNRKGMRGTPPFAAPELYQGRVCAQTDQYALAVSWCDLVGGSRMFRKGIAPDGGPMYSINLALSREREAAVLARALHDDPTRRYSSCVEFVDALRDAARMPRRPAGKWLRSVLSRSRAADGAVAAAK